MRIPYHFEMYLILNRKFKNRINTEMYDRVVKGLVKGVINLFEFFKGLFLN